MYEILQYWYTYWFHSEISKSSFSFFHWSCSFATISFGNVIRKGLERIQIKANELEEQTDWMKNPYWSSISYWLLGYMDIKFWLEYTQSLNNEIGQTPLKLSHCGPHSKRFAFSWVWILIIFQLCPQVSEKNCYEPFIVWPGGYDSVTNATILYHGIFLEVYETLPIQSSNFWRCFDLDRGFAIIIIIQRAVSESREENDSRSL